MNKHTYYAERQKERAMQHKTEGNPFTIDWRFWLTLFAFIGLILLSNCNNHLSLR